MLLQSRSWWAVAAAASLVTAACSSGSSSTAPPATVDAGDAGAAASGPTFHEDVEPILQQHCDMCHVQGGIAPMPLVTYADAKPYAPAMAELTASRTMPPWGAVATSECTPPLPFKNDPSLSDAQIATLSAWSRAGAPEGNPADAPPPLSPHPIALSGVNADLAPAGPFSLTSSSSDEFRCFVLDPGITQTTYLNGSYVVPGNAEIVHHVLVFTDPTGASRKLVTDQATQSYDCFGSAGVSQSLLLSAWAPGGFPADYPSNVGAPLDPGTLLVMQVHYHPHTSTASLAPDQTHFQMRLTTQAPEYEALTVLPGNYSSAVGSSGSGLLPGPDDPPTGPAFVIPPDVSAHTETMQLTIPSSVQNVPGGQVPVLMVGGHEHYVGSAVEVTVHHATPPPSTPADQCLVSIPQWSFSWQRWYAYDAPIDSLPALMAGDVVTIKCTYDNTLGNTQLAQSLQQQGMTQPQTVHLGETTLDEMCLAPMVLLVKSP